MIFSSFPHSCVGADVSCLLLIVHVVSIWWSLFPPVIQCGDLMIDVCTSSVVIVMIYMFTCGDCCVYTIQCGDCND